MSHLGIPQMSPALSPTGRVYVWYVLVWGITERMKEGQHGQCAISERFAALTGR
jgi:hypothetical protein